MLLKGDIMLFLKITIFLDFYLRKRYNIVNSEEYRSGHNEAVLKTVCPKGTRVRIPSSPPFLYLNTNVTIWSSTQVGDGH